MKKFDFKKLALMGITGGVMCATQVNALTTDQPMTGTSSTSTTSAKMNETQFTSKLNAEGKATYMKLDTESKALALKMVNDGTFTDANQAVKSAYDRMEAKRKMNH